MQSPDTDVAVLCVYAYNLIHAQQLWFRTGVKDKVRFLPVHRLAEKLGKDLCSLLPSFHALTGCDSTSALYQIGKRKAWKALVHTKDGYGDLAGLGENVPASSTGFSKAKQARILTREEGSSADFDARGGITCERGARAGGTGSERGARAVGDGKGKKRKGKAC